MGEKRSLNDRGISLKEAKERAMDGKEWLKLAKG